MAERGQKRGGGLPPDGSAEAAKRARFLRRQEQDELQEGFRALTIKVSEIEVWMLRADRRLSQLEEGDDTDGGAP